MQIVAAGLFVTGFPTLDIHIGLGHFIQLPLIITLILAWRGKAGRPMLSIISLIMVLAIVQANVLGISTDLSPLNQTNTFLVAHGVNALLLYTLAMVATIEGLRR